MSVLIVLDLLAVFEAEPDIMCQTIPPSTIATTPPIAPPTNARREILCRFLADVVDVAIIVVGNSTASVENCSCHDALKVFPLIGTGKVFGHGALVGVGRSVGSRNDLSPSEGDI